MSSVNARSNFKYITLLNILLVLLSTGCASTNYLLKSEILDYKSRAETFSNGAVQVTASALSDDEASDVYGLTLARKDVQPVWIEVENGDEEAYWLMSPGVDPNFFAASEVAEAFATTHEDETREVLERRFQALAFRNPVLFTR